MKTLALIFNFVLLGFTCLVLLTDGPPIGVAYIVFTLWTILTLVLSPVVLFRSSAGNVINTLAVILNAVLIGFTCWAIINQYPHPKEGGLIPFTVLMFLTPVLNLVVILMGLKAGRTHIQGNTGIHFGLTL